MLGMKSLQAATESGYPQSWACLGRHADSLCRSAWFSYFQAGIQLWWHVTPNWAGTCCRDARIIKSNRPYLYGRRFPWLRVKSQPLDQSELRNSIWLSGFSCTPSLLPAYSLTLLAAPLRPWWRMQRFNEIHSFEDVDIVELLKLYLVSQTQHTHTLTRCCSRIGTGTAGARLDTGLQGGSGMRFYAFYAGASRQQGRDSPVWGLPMETRGLIRDHPLNASGLWLWLWHCRIFFWQTLPNTSNTDVWKTQQPYRCLILRIFLFTLTLCTRNDASLSLSAFSVFICCLNLLRCSIALVCT